MKKVPLIAQIISLACALVAVGAVLLWAAPCAGSLELANGNMVPMRCAYTSKVAVLLALMAFIRHRGNISRLIHGNERKTYLTKKNKED